MALATKGEAEGSFAVALGAGGSESCSELSAGEGCPVDWVGTFVGAHA